MARVAETIAELGPGEYDGEKAVIDLGQERIRLLWDDTGEVWVGEEQITCKVGDVDPLDIGGSVGVISYVSNPLDEAVQFGYSVTNIGIRGALSAFNAGLTLQEKIDADFWIWSANADYDIVMVYYSYDDGDLINPAVTPDASSPGRNCGTFLAGVPTVRCMSTTEWVDCPIDVPTAENLAPHLYGRTNAVGDGGGARVERLTSYIRWVGAP